MAKETTHTNRSASRIASIYASLWSQYHQKPPFDWQRDLHQDKRKMALAAKAAAVADSIPAVYRDFVEAQFYWISDRLDRAPYWTELGSGGSIVRYSMWKQREEKGRPALRIHPALLESVAIPEGTQIQFEHKVLQQMIRQWGSEEQVWAICGDPQEDEVFSLAFKKTRPLWLSLYGDKA